jgi:hypothetical protein
MKEADAKDLTKPLISPTTTPTGDLSGYEAPDIFCLALYSPLCILPFI